MKNKLLIVFCFCILLLFMVFNTYTWYLYFFRASNGFEISNNHTQSNVLEFRKEGVSVGVDMIIWPEIYIMRVCSLGNTQ